MEQALGVGFKALLKANKAMLTQDKFNLEMLTSKGELSVEAVAAYDKTHREFDALQVTSASTFHSRRGNLNTRMPLQLSGLPRATQPACH